MSRYWNNQRLNWAWKNRQRRNRTQPLRATLSPFVEKWVGPRQKKRLKLAQAWQHLLPPELAEHSCVDSLARGQLRVLVDSAAHLAELNFMVRQGDLLEQLQEECPGVNVSRIKLVRGHWRHVAEDGADIVDF